MMYHKEHALLGWSLGLGGSVFTSFYIIFYKQLSLNSANPIVGVTMLFIMCCIFSGIIMIFERNKHFTVDKKLLLFIPMVMVSISGNLLTLLSFQYLKPSITQVLQRTEIIFTMILSFLFLREIITSMIWACGCIVMAGILLINFERLHFDLVSWLGILYVLGASLAFSLLQMFSKMLITNATPGVINFIRQTGTAIALIFFLYYSSPTNGEIFVLYMQSNDAWKWASLAALFGPVIGRLCFLYSFKYIELSKTAISSSLSPLLSMNFEYVMLGIVISWNEAVGGLFILFGIILAVYSSYKDHYIN